MSLPVSKPMNIICRQPVNKVYSAPAVDPDLAHVRYIKKSAACTRPKMLFQNSGGILDGHIPAAEIDHSAAKLTMDVI
jgi:hypothetical protein